MHALARIFPKLFGYIPELPTPEEAKSITESCAKSPDIGLLEQYEFQLLFCPDRTQRGCSEYSMIEDSVYLSYGYTLKKFNYWQQRDGLPIPMLATSEERLRYFPPPLKVKGEIHAVRPYQFRELDNLRDNRVQFRRQRVKLLVPRQPLRQLPTHYANGKPIPLVGGQYAVGKERVRPIEAWMYVGEPWYWDELMDAGFHSSNLFKTVDHYEDERPWLKEYYSLRREEYF
jgi:hypothetical protein